MRPGATRPDIWKSRPADLLGYSAEEIVDSYAKDVIGNSHHYDTLPG